MNQASQLSTAPSRVLLVGGSIAHGLGVRGNPFGKRIGAHAPIRPEVLDLTGSGRMIDEVLDGERDSIVDFGPDVAVICAGMSERLVHAPARFQAFLNRYAPTTWHGVAGLQPRAYYSQSPVRRRRQRIVSGAKVAVKRTVLRFGSHQRMSLDEVERHLSELIDLLGEQQCRVIVLGTARVDEQLFPGTEKAYQELSERLAALAAGSDHVRYLDPRPHLHCWDDYVDDHCHWNDQGHDRIARAVEGVLAGWDAPARRLVDR